MNLINTIWQGLSNAFLMAWTVWWALVLGFAISAIVQAWVPRVRIERALCDREESFSEGLIAVEQWAEIRRMHFVQGLSINGIARRTGDRKTIQRAIRSPEPPGYQRARVGSKLDAHRQQIAQLLRDEQGRSAG